MNSLAPQSPDNALVTKIKPALSARRTGVASEVHIASATILHRVPSLRFTRDGSAELEEHLGRVCRSVATEVRRLIPATQLEGLLLGGGYGRGEGGVWRTDSGDRPYNDLEFYVFVRGNAVWAERRYREALSRLGQRLSPGADLDVEFKVLTLGKLRSAAPSMFYYDLVCGHRWLIGDDSLLAGCEPHGEARNIPLQEATRLLMNRCSGLLFSAERLGRESFGPDEADFVGRNLAKMQLAFGDVLLTAHGNYHWSCQERHRRLSALMAFEDPPWRDCLLRHHRAGVAFKLHPTRSSASREALAREHRDLSGIAQHLWLWLESRRLKTVFANPGEYARSPIDKCPETFPLRNRLVNLSSFGPRVALSIGGSRYPRQRLFHALCLLLWEGTTRTDAQLLQQVQTELNTSTADFAGWVAAYERLWHRFN